MTFKLNRDEIARAFDTPRAVKAFERLQDTVAANDEAVAAALGPTGALNEATFVTLSPNAELPNERVLTFGSGLSFTLTATQITIRLSANVPTVTGGFRVQIVAGGDSTVAVPPTGILATTENAELFKNKTLAGATTSITGLGDYVDDAAAAVGLVPVGGLYRTGSQLKVRVA